MYTLFFNFKKHPFKLTPDPEFLFLSRIHKKALMYMKYGITSDAGGFILLTGEVGTGKTTVLRSILKEIDQDTVFARIYNSRLSSEQLMAAINDDFGLDTKGKDKILLLKDLTSFLIDQFSSQKKSILIIDEAQNLSPDLLEEIRLLSNLETDKAKLLQIILIGQSELRKVLDTQDLRALRQRITVSCHILPLNREETKKYIFHRLDVAGNRDAIAFQDGSIDQIHQFSRGIPRLINILCDFILLTAFSEQSREISVEMVRDVVNDLELDNKYWTTQNDEWQAMGAVIPSAGKGSAMRKEGRAQAGNGDQELNSDKIKIFDGFAEMHKKFDTAIDLVRQELIGETPVSLEKRLSDIMNEMQELKKTISKIQGNGREGSGTA
jgi:putative secretion ATPase (PEP-CTERM system associated)